MATDTSSPRLTRRWLLDDAADSLVRGLQFLEWNAFDGWSELEPVLRAGHPRRPLYERLEEDPAASRAFQAWDLAAARLTAPAIVARLVLPARSRRLLDLGGGNGYYSVLLCRRLPAMSSTIVDLPGALDSRAT